MIFFSATVVTTCEQLISYQNSYIISDIFSTSIIAIAITYTYWIPGRAVNIYIQCLSVLSFFVTLNLSSIEMNKFYVGFSFILLASWSIINQIFLGKYYLAFRKRNKLIAFKETIALLNHEFNNVNMIAMLLFKRHKKNEVKDKAVDDFELVINRMSSLIRKLDELDEYETEEYVDGTQIAKLN